MNLNEQIIQVFNDSQEVTFDIAAGIEAMRDIFHIAAADEKNKVKSITILYIICHLRYLFLNFIFKINNI